MRIEISMKNKLFNLPKRIPRLDAPDIDSPASETKTQGNNEHMPTVEHTILTSDTI